MARERLLVREKETRRKKRKIRPFGFSRNLTTEVLSGGKETFAGEAPEVPETLESGKPYKVIDVLESLTSEPVPENPYQVDTAISADFASVLSRDQLKSLETRQSSWVWDKDSGQMVLNPEVSQHVDGLFEDPRFEEALSLTKDESILLAFASASAPTPEQQATLYKTLGETVLRTHSANPELLGEFLRGQSQESREEFAEIDAERADPRIQEKLSQLPETPSQADTFTPEQQEYMEFKTDVLRNFALYPDRMLSLAIVTQDSDFLDQQLAYHVNIPETAEAWRPRIATLQEAFRSDPFSLTVEQIAQIEFLSHSVDTRRVLALLKGQEIDIPLVQQAVAQEENTKEEMGETRVPSETLDTLFTSLSNGEESFAQGADERRQEFAIQDSSAMREFSTENENVTRFEIVNERGELAIFSLDKANQEGIDNPYNTRDPFIDTLTKGNSLSVMTLARLHQSGFGQNTLLAYAFEAVSAPRDQAMLTRNLFLQIARIYKEHEGLSGVIRDYMQSIEGKASPYRNSEENDRQTTERLFGNQKQAETRIGEITEKLQSEKALTVEDIADMGAYALPFNLQFIAQRMEMSHNMHNADSQ